MNLEFSKIRLTRRLTRGRSPVRWRTAAPSQADATRTKLWPRPKTDAAVGGTD